MSYQLSALRLTADFRARGLLVPAQLSLPDSVDDKDHWTSQLTPVAL